MLIVFLSGALGFLIFDIYRIYAEAANRGHLIVTFFNFKAISAHLVIYFAAGFLGVFVNADVLLNYTQEGDFVGIHISELFGALLRAFSLGVLGPAGLSKTSGSRKVSGGLSPNATGDDTAVVDAGFRDYLEYFLRR